MGAIFDVASIGYSAHSLAKKTSWRNAGYLAWDIGAAAIPFVPGSYSAKGLKVASKVKVHNNSLKTTKLAKGYALVHKNTKVILKFGETTRDTKRYIKNI